MSLRAVGWVEASRQPSKSACTASLQDFNQLKGNNMKDKIFSHPTVVRTSRGLSIAGTRITLYQIMDYLKANEPPEVIRDDFR